MPSLLERLIVFLAKLNLVKLSRLIILNCFFSSDQQFFLIFGLSYGLSVSNLVFTRYVVFGAFFLHTLSLSSLPFLLYIIYILGLFGLLLRLSINLSFLVDSCATKLSILPVLHFGEHGDHGAGSVPSNTEAPKNSSTDNSWSLFSYHRHQHRHAYNYTPGQRVGIWRGMGFALGVATLSVGAAAAYYGKQQAEYGKLQAYETRREADVAAVDGGLISKEEYYRRHPQDKPR